MIPKRRNSFREGTTRHAFRGLSLILLLALACGIVSAQTGGQPQNAAATNMSNESQAKFDELRTAGFDALYNLDYEVAKRNFKEIARLFPDHPAGPQFLAAALWAQTLNQSRRLQASIYSSESFYAREEDKVDPQTIEQFREWTKAAAQLAKARLKKNPNDIEALYFLGATEGLKAAFAAAVQRSFMSALRDGESSVDRHRDVIKLDPNYHDAELTIGLYDYVVGSLGRGLKILATIIGKNGSKKRGLASLQRVATQGRWARDDAKALLIVLLKREKRYNEALAISRDLAAKYPRNYLFQLESADALIAIAATERQAGRTAETMKAEQDALAVFDALLRDRMKRESASRSLDLINFRYGETLLEANQLDNAAQAFLAAANTTGAEPALATLAYLQAARAFDLAGKRNDALAQYRVVLARPDAFEAHEAARQGLKEPYKIKKTEKSTEEE